MLLRGREEGREGGREGERERERLREGEREREMQRKMSRTPEKSKARAATPSGGGVAAVHALNANDELPVGKEPSGEQGWECCR